MKKERKADPFYIKANMERLRKSIAQMDATGGTVHEVFNSDDEIVYSKLLETEKSNG